MAYSQWLNDVDTNGHPSLCWCLTIDGHTFENMLRAGRCELDNGRCPSAYMKLQQLTYGKPTFSYQTTSSFNSKGHLGVRPVSLLFRHDICRDNVHPAYPFDSGAYTDGPLGKFLVHPMESFVLDSPIQRPAQHVLKQFGTNAAYVEANPASTCPAVNGHLCAQAMVDLIRYPARQRELSDCILTIELQYKGELRIDGNTLFAVIYPAELSANIAINDFIHDYNDKIRFREYPSAPSGMPLSKEMDFYRRALESLARELQEIR